MSDVKLRTRLEMLCPCCKTRQWFKRVGEIDEHGSAHYQHTCPVKGLISVDLHPIPKAEA